ncbi:MAG TPA: FlxA-like family protein [Methylophilaceae bacterium]|jgi:hypothetical protein
MTASVASAGYTGYTASSASGSNLTAAGIQAQIAIYQRQLSDCVNCSSASTIEGKTEIQDISSKISAAKSQIQQLQDQAPQKTSTPKNNGTTNANASVNAVANAPVTRALTIAPGNNIDVFA